ncbi:hypothetical protein J3R80_09075 [Aliiroseovarius sp. Z3]|nr:hypothetical protein [Aliiroseovarius sp. Z3]
MRWFRRGISAALVIWVLLAHAFAQNLPDGLTTGDDGIRSLLGSMLGGQADVNLQRFLQGQVVCTDDQAFAAFLNERGIRTLVTTVRSGALALRAGRCNLLIEGPAVRWVRAVLESARPEPTPTPADRDGPVIEPIADEFTSSSGSVAIVADITDPSGVANTEASGARLVERNGDRYAFSIRLPDNYARALVGISAEDRAGNSSTRRVAIRRIPACGPPNGLDVAMARVIQSDLNALGLNAGVVDGLVGAGTCGAIRRFEPAPVNSWPALQAALARARIGITAQRRSDPSEAEQMVIVSVSDPRDTGLVAWIRATVDGRSAEPDRRAQSGEILYRFTLNPGAALNLRFDALDGRARILAQTRLTLRRLPDMTLDLASAQLQDGRITAAADRVQVEVTLRNPWPDASVDWQTSDPDAGDRRRYAGVPIVVDLPMPDPAERGTATFLAVDRDGSIRARETLTLLRLADMRLQVEADELAGDVIETTNPDATIVVDLMNAWPGAKLSVDMPGSAPEIWAYGGQPRAVTVAAPPPGQSRALAIRVRDTDGVERDTRTIDFRRVASGPPGWLIPGAIGLLLLASVIWPIRGFRLFRNAKEPQSPAPTIPPRLYAVPDTTPVISVIPDQMAAITLTVDPGGVTDITIIQEQHRSDGP